MSFGIVGAGPIGLACALAAKRRGLDPNVWFGNVEQIASERIGRETVTYVSNIYKYYIAYSLIVQQMDEKAKAKAEGGAR